MAENTLSADRVRIRCRCVHLSSQTVTVSPGSTSP